MEGNHIKKIKTSVTPDYVRGLDPLGNKNKPSIYKIEKRARANKKKNTKNIDPFHA